MLADFAAPAGNAAGPPVLLRMAADMPAGSAGNPRLPAGSAVRIMTGAPMPDDADTVLPVEHTDGGTGTVSVAAVSEPGAHVRRAGEEVRAGSPVLVPGSSEGPVVRPATAGGSGSHRVASPATAGALAIVEEDVCDVAAGMLLPTVAVP